MSRRWATAVVALVAIGAGVGGGISIWKEAFPSDSGIADDAGISDGGKDARAKSKSGKKGTAKKGGARPGKPRRPSNAGNTGNSDNPLGPATGSIVPGSGDDTPDDEEGDDDTVDFQPPFRGRGPAGPTYEAAIASNKQEVTIGGNSGTDLTDAQLHGPMQSGHFVGECGAPESMKVTVRVAVKLGRPVGVSVSSSPFDPDITGCIDRYVRTFSWPSNPKMDSFTTTY